MEDYLNLEAARLYADSIVLLQNDLTNQSISYSEPEDSLHLEILRESNCIHEHVVALSRDTRQIYHNDIEMREKTAGRLVDIAMPVRLSGGLIDIAKLMDSAEGRLSRYEDTIEKAAQQARFGNNCRFEELARIAISLDRKMIERTRLYLHAHLWMLWTLESLQQADQIYGLMHRQDRFSDVGEDAFAYLAHPPIIVSTLACTAMIEEVGATYINQLVPGKSIPPDGTRASGILDVLDGEFQDHPDFNVRAIDETIVTARNNISHYLSKRPEAVTSENFEEYVNQGIGSIHLVATLVDDMFMDVVESYREQVLYRTVDR